MSRWFHAQAVVGWLIVGSLALLCAGCNVAGLDGSDDDMEAPAEVTGVTAYAVTNGVALTWTLPTTEDFDHCEVWCGPNLASVTLVDNSVSGTSFTIDRLTAGAEYTIVIKTVDDKDNASTGTSVVQATMPATYEMVITDAASHANMDTATNTWTNTAAKAVVSSNLLAAALAAGNDITLQSANLDGGEIVVSHPIDARSLPTARTLTLSSHAGVQIRAAIQDDNTMGGSVDLVLNTGGTRVAVIKAEAELGSLTLTVDDLTIGGTVSVNGAGVNWSLVTFTMQTDSALYAAGPMTLTAGVPMVIDHMGTLVDSPVNDITLTCTGGSIAINGHVSAGSLGGITLDAQGGGITDQADSLITADALTSDSAGNTSLRVAVNTINASTTAAGTMQITATGDVELMDVDTLGGAIAATSTAAITATDVHATGGSLGLSGSSLILGSVSAGGNTVTLVAENTINGGTFSGSHADITAGTIGLSTPPTADVTTLTMGLDDHVGGRSGEVMPGAALVTRPDDGDITTVGTVQIGAWSYTPD